MGFEKLFQIRISKKTNKNRRLTTENLLSWWIPSTSRTTYNERMQSSVGTFYYYDLTQHHYDFIVFAYLYFCGAQVPVS
jgi:hypothetical protein